jgi:hypothetical protein
MAPTRRPRPVRLSIVPVPSFSRDAEVVQERKLSIKPGRRYIAPGQSLVVKDVVFWGITILPCCRSPRAGETPPR